MATGNGLTIAATEIRRTLAEILRSPYFVESQQSRDFLTYVVNKTLDGKQSELKAYTIAVDALGRSEDFDPQSNAAVRVAAGRLRLALTAYNADTSASKNAVRITLEPGSYIPSFERVETGQIQDSTPDQNEEAEIPQSNPNTIVPLPTVNAQPSKWNKLIGFAAGALVLLLIGAALTWFLTNAKDQSGTPVSTGQLDATQPGSGKLDYRDVNRRPIISATVLLPDNPYPDWFNAKEFADTLAVVTAKFDDYQVLDTKNTRPVLDTKGIADYHLFVTAYRRDNEISVLGKLVRESSGVVIWSTQLSYKQPEAKTGRSLIDIVGSAYSPLASPYGVLYQDLLNPASRREKLDCVISTYQYFNNESDDAHRKARDCAEERIVQGTRLPTVYAMLTFLYLDEYRVGRNRKDRDPLNAAEAMASKAVELGPQSAKAHQALFAVYKVLGKRTLARQAAEKAVALNSYDSDILGDYGAWLISIGDIAAGNDLLNRAGEMLPSRPAWFEFYRYIGAELAGEFKRADDIDVLLDARRSPLLAIAVALGAGRRGESQKARAALDVLTASAPGFTKDPTKEFLVRGFDPKVAQRLVDLLKNAGLEVQPSSMN